MSVTNLHQRYRGTYVATVGSGVDPEGLGRVRVRTDQVEDTSDAPLWAIVARPLGGSGSTLFFTPKENDQVIISYLQGDPRQPVVLGYAHYDKRQPADVGPRRHAIVTDAGRITFDEDEGEMTLEIGGSSITLSREQISIRATAVDIRADSVCINGQGVVLASFLSAFDTHVHSPGGATPIPLPAPGAPTSTACDDEPKP